MSKIWQIAKREFVATVFTKAFIIGLADLAGDFGADGRARRRRGCSATAP